MTRKDYVRYAKIFGLSLLVSVPLLIALDILISKHISQVVLVILNVALIIAGFVGAIFIAEKRAKHIAKKRQEFLDKQAQEEKLQEQQQNTEMQKQQTQQTKNKKLKKKHK